MRLTAPLSIVAVNERPPTGPMRKPLKALNTGMDSEENQTFAKQAEELQNRAGNRELP